MEGKKGKEGRKEGRRKTSTNVLQQGSPYFLLPFPHICAGVNTRILIAVNIESRVAKTVAIAIVSPRILLLAVSLAPVVSASLGYGLPRSAHRTNFTWRNLLLDLDWALVQGIPSSMPRNVIIAAQNKVPYSSYVIPPHRGLSFVVYDDHKLPRKIRFSRDSHRQRIINKLLVYEYEKAM